MCLQKHDRVRTMRGIHIWRASLMGLAWNLKDEKKAEES